MKDEHNRSNLDNLRGTKAHSDAVVSGVPEPGNETTLAPPAEPLRIVIDMQGAQTESRFRGIGRYTLSFAQAVVRNRGKHEIILALSGLFPDTIEPIRAAFYGLLPQENIRVWQAPGPVKEEQPGNEARREIAELIREAFLASLRPDIIHICSLFEGYVDDAVTSIGQFDRSTPVCVTLYDLIPLLNRDQYLSPNPRYAQYYERKAKYLKKAAGLLAISEFTRQEGLEHLALPEYKLANVSTAIGPNFCHRSIDKNTASQLCQRFGLTRPFVLYTGGADERKNLPHLIEAYADLPATLRDEHQLLFSGKMPDGEIAQFRLQAKKVGLKPDELCFTGYLSDEELVEIYNLCKLFIFPSWHEGFGLPALEAMACGAPVIGANTSSLPEVIGMDEALFDPFDVAAISASMARALVDEVFRSRLRANGLQRVKLFSWDETAKRAIAVWESQSTDQSEVSSGIISRELKPKLAFVSPLPPERTGIADYCADLLPALAEYYDIEVVVVQDRVNDPWGSRYIKLRDVSWLKSNTGNVDRVLYQVGNSPFHQHMLHMLREIPGAVVLHDFFLSGLLAWLELHGGVAQAWEKGLYDAHGYGPLQERFLDAEVAKCTYPVNLDVLKYAQGVIVHSEYSRQLARQWYRERISDSWEIIPILRVPTEPFDRAVARKQLRFGDKDFLVCSFGFLDFTKLNHRLLACWIGSALAGDKHCHLVFVGQNHGGEYGANLLQTICSSSFGNRIHITGFASPEIFRQYLMAADLAVQLRTQSRGETSAAVLDCMNHALPVIVNANGSMAELDHQSVWMLPDEFDDSTLIEALETLWRSPDKRQALGERAREIIIHRHSPAECAKRYADAIERFHQHSLTGTPALIRAIAANHQFAPSDDEILHLSKAIATTLPMPQPARCLFLDVTATCRNDLKTGIERVARALLVVMLESPPVGFRSEPVYLSNTNGEWQYRYARKYTLDLLGCPSKALEDDIVEPVSGDILLGLDLSGDILVQAQKAGIFADYRKRGVAVYFLVHDLLPIRMPYLFPPGADEAHEQWLRAVTSFDGAICVSKTVADDLAHWLHDAGLVMDNRRPYRIGWSHHGADVENTVPSMGMPENAELIIEKIKANPSFLMVGTIEPRKGYLQTIESFTQLWTNGLEANLVMVGMEGWRGLPNDMRRDIPETVHKIRTHPQLNERLFWLEGISDEYLEKVYSASTCLIAASFGEGFGLPLIEAAQHRLAIIARDIPVFREVAGEYAYYFNAQTPEALEQAINTWLKLYCTNQHPKSERMPWLTWKDSAEQLLEVVLHT